MVSRLRPIDMKFVFEDRPYRLGDPIDLSVDLEANREVEIREGRVDLVCEERWTEVSRKSELLGVVDEANTARGALGHSRSSSGDLERGLVFRDTFIHSSVPFLGNARLESGSTHTFSPILKIERRVPPHAREGEVRWSLVATVDVVAARDITRRHRVRVRLT